MQFAFTRWQHIKISSKSEKIIEKWLNIEWFYELTWILVYWIVKLHDEMLIFCWNSLKTREKWWTWTTFHFEFHLSPRNIWFVLFLFSFDVASHSLHIALNVCAYTTSISIPLKNHSVHLTQQKERDNQLMFYTDSAISSSLLFFYVVSNKYFLLIE